MKRIGMLTSGGDCQALNAAMRGVAKTLFNSGEKVEIYGFQDGYQGLIYGRFKLLTYADFTGILTKGGTFLGTSRTPFKTIQIPGDDGVIVREIVLGKTEWKIYASAGGKVSYTGASAASGERYSLKAGEPFVIISDCELEFVSE